MNVLKLIAANTKRRLPRLSLYITSTPPPPPPTPPQSSVSPPPSPPSPSESLFPSSSEAENFMDLQNLAVSTPPEADNISDTARFSYSPPIHHQKLIMDASRSAHGIRARSFYNLEWYKTLLTMSFVLLISLMSATYTQVGEVMVLSAFKSKPALFPYFVFLIAIVFFISLTGFLLHGEMHRRVDYSLFLLAFSTLSTGCFLFIWVLLPDHLKAIPIVFGSTIFIMMLYLWIWYKDSPIDFEYEK